MEWGCTKCRGEGFEAGDELREARGCDGPPAGNLGFAFDASLRRCPWSQLDRDSFVYLNWWSDWVQFKALPWGGSDAMEQPAFVMEVLELCENEKKSKEKKDHEKRQAELERSRKKAKRHGRA